MFYVRPFLPEDIFNLDLTNLDSFTENYSLDYYLEYFTKGGPLIALKRKIKKNEKYSNNLLNSSNKSVTCESTSNKSATCESTSSKSASCESTSSKSASCESTSSNSASCETASSVPSCESTHSTSPQIFSSLKFGSPVFGYCIIRREHDDADTSLFHISSISVSPLCRRMRLGTELLKQIIGTAESMWIEGIGLNVRSSNTAAIEFYQKNDFYIKKVKDDYYDNPVEPAYYMRKNLQNNFDYI